MMLESSAVIIAQTCDTGEGGILLNPTDSEFSLNVEQKDYTLAFPHVPTLSVYDVGVSACHAF
jgi:hypothetical protein